MQTHSTVRGGRRLVWHTERLWALSADLEPFELRIDAVPELDQDCWFGDVEPTLRRMVDHCRRINEADPARPVILNADGSLMDGGHRLCRALLEGRDTVPAVRFGVMPEPDDVVPVDQGR